MLDGICAWGWRMSSSQLQWTSCRDWGRGDYRKVDLFEAIGLDSSDSENEVEHRRPTTKTSRGTEDADSALKHFFIADTLAR